MRTVLSLLSLLVFAVLTAHAAPNFRTLSASSFDTGEQPPAPPVPILKGPYNILDVMPCQGTCEQCGTCDRMLGE